MFAEDQTRGRRYCSRARVREAATRFLFGALLKLGDGSRLITITDVRPSMQLRIAGCAKGGVCDSRASVLLNAQWQHRAGFETREHSGRGL